MKILITAGPTREPIDPVRYISNRSSGKMGYAIGEAAITAGHEVVLISGPVHIPLPEGLAEAVTVETAREMYEAVRDRIDECDAAVSCAAVADYRVREISERKIKKASEGDTLTLVLEQTEDILGSARSVFGFEGILVGFAAETENLDANARAKLERKGCDLLVANDVSRRDIGFDRDENEIQLFFADGRHESMPLLSKTAVGEKLVEIVEELVKGAAG
jgi:phosphopantothenoylcysteine synthetase/decarboxylase